eukprot:COSAG04_NODE_17779_length_459_cov_0.852778_1_plen_80_part_10
MGGSHSPPTHRANRYTSRCASRYPAVTPAVTPEIIVLWVKREKAITAFLAISIALFPKAYSTVVAASFDSFERLSREHCQ